MYQSGLDRSGKCDTMKYAEKCHRYEKVAETELHSSSQKRHCPTVLHVGGQERKYKLLVVTVQQKK